MRRNGVKMKRCGGVLMHISSVPGKYGIGTLGKEAYRFADFLAGCGFGAWQVLPICPCDRYNSPYSGSSAFAGNVFLIDPELLFYDGLITAEELEACVCGDVYSVQYDFLHESRPRIFRNAFRRADGALLDAVRKFMQNERGMYDYAFFCALKENFGGRAWYEWTDGLKFREKSAMEAAEHELGDEILYHAFLQYEFYRQWGMLKKHANEKGVGIIGDMPIYLSRDSAEVWANPKLFSLDGDMELVKCAGVPPDYFCADGQKWGNPLYDWAELEADGYSLWIDRLRAAEKHFDAVRIDHFRAFASYWEIPADKSAKYGEWVKGPGMKFFDEVKKQCPGLEIIAEDLGEIDDEVRALLRKTGFPGMGVIQFAFISDDDSTHLPHNYSTKTIGYTGTHDNNTILGWLWESDESSRRYALDYCGFSGDWGEGGPRSGVIRSIIRTLWRSSAICAIVPVQDLCGFGGDTRMNRPGIAGGNWEFRLTESAMGDIDGEFYKGLNRLYKRDAMNDFGKENGNV